MIDLKTKADNYAELNSKDIIAKALAKAYADGYRDGYKDREEEILINLNYSNTEFIDLGLPSGTCWSVDYEMENKEVIYSLYEQVSQLSLPTAEQVNELFENCIWSLHDGMHDKYCYLCIGPNGNSISFSFSGYMIPKPIGNIVDRYWHANFWVKKQEESLEKQSALLSIEHDQLERRIVAKELKHFNQGFMLPIRLISNKK